MRESLPIAWTFALLGGSRVANSNACASFAHATQPTQSTLSQGSTTSAQPTHAGGRQPWPTNNEMHRISLSFRRGKSREPVPSEPLGACPDPERSEGEWGDEGRNPFENWNRVRIPNPFAKGISRRLSCLRQHGSLAMTIEAQLRLYFWCPFVLSLGLD